MALTQDQIANLKELVASIWNASIANNIDYNDDVLDVLAAATKALADCNQTISLTFMSLAGAAAGGYVIFSRVWLRDLALDIAKEVNDNHQQGWAPCVNTVAASYRTRLEMASMGI